MKSKCRLSDFLIIEKQLVKVSKVIFISSGSPENLVFLLKLHFESKNCTTASPEKDLAMACSSPVFEGY